MINDKNKKMIMHIFGVMTIVLILYLSVQTIRYIFSEKNEYGITSGKIIKEVENEQNIFVFVEEDGLTLYKFRREDNKLKRVYALNLGLVFNYDRLVSNKGKNESKRTEVLKESLKSLYNSQKIYRYKLFFGVSPYPEIKNLKVNNQKVDGVFEYHREGHNFYIWYFYDLKFNPDHFEVSLEE